ncbi:hypothetical protein BLNAU_3342 [Blattamonas nauphoetae]|uniref:Uncharacterized protein n=1 Tax=Blattamonas nauphoetae TaxID=2049346 RepID=A0ABQ9YCT4_9EUKA|nr:hypothetical protein BLNAU_3342 [Blattamonas nauphoetae]
MEQFYSVLSILCRHSDDHELYLLVSSISKTAITIAKTCFTRFNFSHKMITDTIISKACVRWTHISSLNLAYTQVTNKILEILIKNMPQLESVGLAGCTLSDDISLAFRQLFISPSRLSSIDFSETQLSDIFLATVAATPVSTIKQRPLEMTLHMSNCSKITNPKKSSPFERDEKRASAFLVKDLSFSNCMDLSNRMLSFLLRNLTPTFNAVLHNLDLTNCAAITDEGCAIIATSCPNLQKLVLWGCQLISDAGISAICRRCRALTHLDVTNCRKLTDSACMFISGVVCEDPQLSKAHQHLFTLVEGVRPKATKKLSRSATAPLTPVSNDETAKGPDSSPKPKLKRAKPKVPEPIRPKILPPQFVDISHMPLLSPTSAISPMSPSKGQHDFPNPSPSPMIYEIADVKEHTMTTDYGCPCLQTLVIGKIELTNQSLSYLTTGCPLLSTLDIHSTASEIDASGLVHYIPKFAVAQHNGGSEFTLLVGGMPKITGFTRKLKRLCPNLNVKFGQ